MVNVVTESTADLRSVGRDRLPPTTPCITPCFVSPRMAFTTQFSYDSPIQIITSTGSDMLKPVAKWRVRWPCRSLLCSRKGLLFVALLTIGIVSFLLLNGMDSPLEEGQCDVQDPATPCPTHPTHGAINPLQKFLRQESSIWEQSPADYGQSEEEEENTETLEERDNRPRMLTIQGQYEDSEEFDADHDTPEVYVKDGEEPGEEKTEERKSLQEFPLDEHLRGRRAFRGEYGEFLGTRLDSEEHQSMKVISEEVLPDNPQEIHAMELKNEPEGPSQQYTRREQFQYEPETLDHLYVQQRNLERHNYHREEQIVHKELKEQEMLRHHQQELWQEQRRQPHHWSREGHPLPRRQGGEEHWEVGRPSSMSVPHQGEAGRVEGRHPAWRDNQHHGQRLPRGVNPRRYYMHDDF